MLKDIHLIGSGGLTRDFLACFRNEITIAGIWDDGVSKGTFINGVPVLVNVDEFYSQPQSLQFVIMVTNPILRKQFGIKLNTSIHSSPVIVHSFARIFDSGHTQIGNGCVIFPGTMITTGVEIGVHTLMHTNCSIHHDSKIGSYCMLMPGARLTGNVVVGDEVFVGANVALTNGMNIENGERVDS